MSKADMNKGMGELFDEMVAERASLILADKTGSTRIRGRSAIGAFEKYCITHDDGRTRESLLSRYEVTLQIGGETLTNDAAVDRLQEIHDTNSLRLRGDLLRRGATAKTESSLRGTLGAFAKPAEPTRKLRGSLMRHDHS